MTAQPDLTRLSSLAILLATSLSISACRGDGDPAAVDKRNDVVQLTAESVPGITVSLRADREAVSPGETVHFTAIARNATPTRVLMGEQCGPAMDVLVAKQNAQATSVVAENIGDGSPFTCELGAHRFVDPMGTHEMLISWTAPSARGEYVASSGLRRSDGIGNISKPIRVTVR